MLANVDILLLFDHVKPQWKLPLSHSRLFFLHFFGKCGIGQCCWIQVPDAGALTHDPHITSSAQAERQALILTTRTVPASLRFVYETNLLAFIVADKGLTSILRLKVSSICLVSAALVITPPLVTGASHGTGRVCAVRSCPVRSGHLKSSPWVALRILSSALPRFLQIAP